MKTKNRCANCKCDLDIGHDVIKVDEGVMGVKGFVPLEKTLLFCCERCLKDYYDLDDLLGMPSRIP